MKETAIVWFRRDLRLSDNPALAEACRQFSMVVPVFIWAPEEEIPWYPGACTKWWLHHSLSQLSQRLVGLGSQLIIREGVIQDCLSQIIKETGASAVFVNSVYEPAITARDQQIFSHLEKQGILVLQYNGSFLLPPGSLRNNSGQVYRVFTPFFKKFFSSYSVQKALPMPKTMKFPTQTIDSRSIEELKLLPAIRWDAQIAQIWKPGEQDAKRRLKLFLNEGLCNYTSQRDFPAIAGTSSLSPYLHFGEVSPREVWRAVINHQCDNSQDSAMDYLRQLVWREFANNLLFFYPKTDVEPLRPEFRAFPWRKDLRLLRAWKKGMTGYPIVDAGMRQLWQTGWMHNRVRMIVASFLVKDLLQPWQEGAKWFWDTLVDADLANNSFGWQWTAGCGADAAPYFRIFNPQLQGERFDPQGKYVRKYLPELAKLPDKWIHKPWRCPANTLKDCGIVLGVNYPKPIVDHAESVSIALSAYDEIKVTDKEKFDYNVL